MKIILLDSNRFEMYQATKRYIDLTKAQQLSWNQLSSVNIEGVKFAEFSNPHSAFYCLSRKQMKQWRKSGRVFKKLSNEGRAFRE
jgi:hypothetical protein